MKLKSFIIVGSFIVLALCSCSKKKTIEQMEEEFIPKPQMELSQSDTTEVMHLAEQYITYLRNNQLEDAISMLFFLKKDSIVTLPEHMANRVRHTYKRVHGIDYTIDKLVFLSEKDSEVKYTVSLFQLKPGDHRSNKMSFILKPVRREGKWYLTLADTHSDTNMLHGTQIEN